VAHLLPQWLLYVCISQQCSSNQCWRRVEDQSINEGRDSVRGRRGEGWGEPAITILDRTRSSMYVWRNGAVANPAGGSAYYGGSRRRALAHARIPMPYSATTLMPPLPVGITRLPYFYHLPWTPHAPACLYACLFAAVPTAPTHTAVMRSAPCALA